MILYLIRHAQSENNALAENIRTSAGEFDQEAYDNYMQNRFADPALTERGERQAEQLAQHLRHATPKHKAGTYDPGEAEPGEFRNNPYGLTRLYCSPMLRTLQTATPIGDALQLSPQVWVEIHEHGGVFDNSGEGGQIVSKSGLTREKMIEQFPSCQAPAEVTEQGWWFGEGEEDLPACQARAVRVAAKLREMASQVPDDRIALISHGTFLHNLIAALLGRLPGDTYYFALYNSSITRVDFTRSYEDDSPFMVVRYTNRVDHLSPDLIT